MTRLIFCVATALFWLCVLAYGLHAWQMAGEMVGPGVPSREAPAALSAATPRSDLASPGGRTAAGVTDARDVATRDTGALPADSAHFRLDEVALHASPEDCWLVIDGLVYELTDYLEEHPAPAGVIESWCGREASRAYHTKQRGRAHSAAADRLLADFLRGRLQSP